MKLISSCALISFALMLCAFGVSKAVHKKVVKEVEKTFDVEGVSFSPISVSEEVNQDLPAKITGENFYEVSAQSTLLGYAFVDQAPSKTAKFDYLVVFDTELKVVNSKVLVYREEYGGEIGSKRWLKQFLGKSGNDRVSSETNIDAIAGATISVRSMTKSMDNLLQTIGILQKNGNL
ncbi:MAG: FMN-binding protein [Allomuricauda sp.]